MARKDIDNLDFIDELLEEESEKLKTNNSLSIPKTDAKKTSGVKEYDSNGFHVIEYTSPGTKIKMEYNDTHMKVTSNQEVIFNSTVTPQSRDILIRHHFKHIDRLKKMLEDADNIEQIYEAKRQQVLYDFEEAKKNFNYEQKQFYKYQKRSCGCCLIFFLMILLVGGFIVYALGLGSITIIEFIKSLF